MNGSNMKRCRMCLEANREYPARRCCKLLVNTSLGFYNLHLLCFIFQECTDGTTASLTLAELKPYSESELTTELANALRR